ncbi:hypothetical protein KAZ57_03615 [Patescibacteria group bacterium]|nr:hypothetical protein [Patescibacteria group bacterium]
MATESFEEPPQEYSDQRTSKNVKETSWFQKMSKEGVQTPYIYRGINPLEIDSIDADGNLYITPRRRTALTVATPEGTLMHAELLPNPGFSFTTGATYGEFGSHTIRIKTEDVVDTGGTFLPSIDGPDYWYAEMPEGTKVKVELIRGDARIALLGAVANRLAGPERDERFVILPMGEDPVDAGYHKSKGDIRMRYEIVGKKMNILDLPPEFIAEPRLFHSLIITTLVKRKFLDGRSKVDSITMPDGFEYTPESYLDMGYIQEVVNDPKIPSGH